MGARASQGSSLLSVIDVSEGSEPARWVSLPGDRVIVGGTTVWLGPHAEPLLVCQPNRWGVIEPAFPPVPAIVEVDVDVSGLMPMPATVVGWQDRTGRSVDAPTPSHRGRELLDRTARFARRLSGIAGVSVAASPFARTIPLVSPIEAGDLIEGATRHGVNGIRPLPGLAGGWALSISSDHTDEELDRVAEVVAHLVT